MDWDAVKCFLAVAQHESLSEGAAALGLSVATAARRIDALEASLGLKLIRRTSRGTLLTPDGEIILGHALSGERHMTRISRVAVGLRTGAPLGAVRIASTETMIAGVLAPHVGEILDDIPDIKIEFDVNNALSDLNSGEVDLAIRLSRPTADTLVARRLPKIELKPYGAPSYLSERDGDRVGLAQHRLLWLDARYGPIPENVWLAERGLEPAASLRSVSIRALAEACVRGIGVAPLPVFLARTLELEEVPSPPLPSRQPWIVFHRDTRANRVLKRVRDWIVTSCNEVFGTSD